jgi:hypothetical protein
MSRQVPSANQTLKNLQESSLKSVLAASRAIAPIIEQVGKDFDRRMDQSIAQRERVKEAISRGVKLTEKRFRI